MGRTMAMKMTKSPRAFVLKALEIGEKTLPEFSHRNSPKFYTQAQLFAVLMLRQFMKLDLRGVAILLSEASEIREAIGLKKVPHYSTLSYAEKRFQKKTPLLHSTTLR
jgi:hypothetical protein